MPNPETFSMHRLSIAIQATSLAILLTLLVRLWPQSIQHGTAPIDGNAPAVGSVQMALPSAIESALAEIEASLANQARWPQTRVAIEATQEKLGAVVNSLPPSAQEQILPRLVPLRWDIQALWLLASENNPVDSDFASIRALADEINLLRTDAPTDSSAELRQLLVNREESLRDKVTKGERSSAIEKGRAALGARDTKAVELAMRQLAGFEDDEARELSYRLELRRDLDLVTVDLDQIERLADPALRDFGIAKLHQGLTDLRLRVALNSTRFGTPEMLNGQLSGLAQRISTATDKSVKSHRAESIKKGRDYQTWALSQIRLVTEFGALKSTELAKIPSNIDRNNPLSSAYGAAEERAMIELEKLLITRMAPIHQGLLDEAVATWFRKVFQDRFDKLSDPHKIKVVTAFASADKRLID